MKKIIYILGRFKFTFLFIAIIGIVISAIPFSTLWIILASIQIICMLLGIFLPNTNNKEPEIEINHQSKHQHDLSNKTTVSYRISGSGYIKK